ncbi:MAG: GvpL/GvpF family gas vesicle protein [Beijerinckiaceae bacterium]
MTTYRLVGISRPEYAATVLALPVVAKAGVVAVETLGFAALLLPFKKPLAAWMQTRKAEMQGLLDFQKLLEAISSVAPVLPAAYGSTLVTQEQAMALVTGHNSAIAEALDTFGALVQFQIEVRWNMATAIQVLKQENRLDGVDLALANTDRKRFGEALQARMELERQQLSATFLDLLQTAGRDVVRLPTSDETMVLNAAVLVSKADCAALDQAVEQIDSRMADLSIRYLGPLPAVSFANITVTQPESGLLAKAHLTLGTQASASADEIKQAYKHAIRQVHPDAQTAAASTDVTAELSKAQSLVLRAAGAPRDAKGAPLLLDIRREGDITAKGRSWAA